TMTREGSREIVERLREEIAKIDDLLDYNAEKQRIVEILLNAREKVPQEEICKIYRRETVHSAPFFMDSKGDVPPPHHFAKRRKLNSRAKEVHWTKDDDNLLLRAIRAQTRREWIRKILNVRMIRALGGPPIDAWAQIHSTSNLDWKAISTEFFRSKIAGAPPVRSAEDCKIRWLSYLDPRIRKGEWETEEDKTLIRIAKEENETNWQTIAQRLNTICNSGRTPFGCFQRFQTFHNPKVIRREWTKEEDTNLRRLHKKYGNDWTKIAVFMPGRNCTQLAPRWNKHLRPGIKKRVWTVEEDVRLKLALKCCGEGNWTAISRHVPSRTDIQVRSRWVDSLRPTINKTPWTVEEDTRLMGLVDTEGSDKISGVKWAKLSLCFPGRTGSQLWRRWKALSSRATLGEYIEISKKKKIAVPRRAFVTRIDNPDTTPGDYLYPRLPPAIPASPASPESPESPASPAQLDSPQATPDELIRPIRSNHALPPLPPLPTPPRADYAYFIPHSQPHSREPNTPLAPRTTRPLDTSTTNPPIFTINPQISTMYPQILTRNPPISTTTPPLFTSLPTSLMSRFHPPTSMNHESTLTPRTTRHLVSAMMPPISTMNPPISTSNPPISTTTPPLFTSLPTSLMSTFHPPASPHHESTPTVHVSRWRPRLHPPSAWTIRPVPTWTPMSTSTLAMSTSTRAMSTSTFAVPSSTFAVPSSTPEMSTSAPAEYTWTPVMSTSMVAGSSSIHSASTSTVAMSTSTVAMSTSTVAMSTSTVAMSTSTSVMSSSTPSISTSGRSRPGSV
ncbi:hypothetical protein AAMO2058_001059800, partial [Amorphochlora amoebiformis]